MNDQLPRTDTITGSFIVLYSGVRRTTVFVIKPDDPKYVLGYEKVFRINTHERMTAIKFKVVGFVDYGVLLTSVPIYDLFQDLILRRQK